jgi:hypothetical protein
MQGVFKENKDLKYLKEDFKTFLEKKDTKEPTQIIKPTEIEKETLILDEVEL